MSPSIYIRHDTRILLLSHRSLDILLEIIWAVVWVVYVMELYGGDGNVDSD